MLLEDALRDDLVDLVGNQVWFQLEASVEATDEGGLEVRAVNDLLQVLLARHDEPDLSLALVADHLGEAVQFADALVRVADERAHLVDDEDEVLRLATRVFCASTQATSSSAMPSAVIRS